MTDYLAQLASPAVLNHAWRMVRSDRGRWNRDLTMQDVERDLVLHMGQLSRALVERRYQPDDVRCFEVAKASGGTRVICAPTVRDKLVQRAALTVLDPLGEKLFHPCSFGYRPQCTLDMAIARLREWVREGNLWLGDADVERCFDSIPHRAVLKRLKVLCGDRRVVSLVGTWLESVPVKFRPCGRERGLPQGMVLSPFLCNLYLHQLDEVLDRHGIPFVRFADDFVVLGKSEQDARQALATAAASLKRLDLSLNREKTRVIRTSPKHDFLGRHLPKARMRSSV